LQLSTMWIHRRTYSRYAMRQYDLPQVWFKISRFNVTVYLDLQLHTEIFSALLELKRKSSKSIFRQLTTLLS
jgi:hypothetical protein